MRKGVSTQTFLLTPHYSILTLLARFVCNDMRMMFVYVRETKEATRFLCFFCSFSFFKIFGPDPPRHQYGPFSVFSRVGRERREKYEFIGEREAGRKSTLGQGGVAGPSHGGQEEGHCLRFPSFSLSLSPPPPDTLAWVSKWTKNHSIRRKPIWFSLR